MSIRAPSTLYQPNDPVYRLRLVQKRDEYRERLFLEPESAIDTATKLIILDTLLESETGAIGTDDIYALICCDHAELWAVLEEYPMVWVNACRVVMRYCRGELDKLVDGTGLPGSNPNQSL